MRRFVSCLVGVSSLLAGCGGRDPALPWLHPKLATRLSFLEQTVPSRRDIWRSDGDVLRWSAVADRESENDLLKLKLVMVSVLPNSELATRLRDDARTFGFFPRSSNRSTLALVAAGDGLVVEGLAAAAHAAAGHACGAVTQLALQGLALPPETLAPAVFPEAAALTAVPGLLAQVDQDKLASTVRELEAFGTRYHSSESGLETTGKIAAQFRAAGIEAAGAQLSEIDHSAADLAVTTKQKSLIVTFPGATDDGTTVVIGAHLDSINRSSDQAPGADDDASGIATLVEIARVIAASGSKFQRRIELHAYAAEEVGLVGSTDIAYRYLTGGRNVAAMLQIDMNSWSRDPSRQTIHLVTTDTHANLRRSLKDLLHTYLGGDFLEKQLGAGTSDHRAWTDAGFPAVFPFEDPDDYNHALHTANDTSATANNLALTKRFAELGIAFLAHYAGLVDAADTDAAAAQAALRAALPADLKLAVTPTTGTAGWYDISVAVPTSVAAVEFCVIASAASLGCTKARISGNEPTALGERRLFFPRKSLALSDGARLAVFGYDARDKLVAYRTVRLAAKH